ncbi:hypothetical protein NIES4075_72830 [Tolypothrix sp. NIES-4075]|uniref:hypothetical protein n=1 Tax=Tolypothrix sp. NIES-4075 TaxID=2005459 RepID=UPI000B5C2816|nr:hypothetical protein [Tolypothrix sp. NIES-4075]GAX46262.1 hypothetical protein NIES4075_72830 [Tolypothrix sp. NIES-4075]
MDTPKRDKRGGTRPGAGRKPGYESTLKKEPTKVVRVPESLDIQQLLQFKIDIADKLEVLAEKIRNKEKGYQPNSASGLIRDLMQLLE